MMMSLDGEAAALSRAATLPNVQQELDAQLFKAVQAAGKAGSTTASVVPEVARLLAKGATADGFRTERGSSALHAAAIAGSTQVLSVLATALDGAALDAADKFDNTPLYYACHSGHAEVAALLVQRGCRDDATRRCWRNALDRSALPKELRQGNRSPEEKPLGKSRLGAARERERRRKASAAALAAEVGVDVDVALAMLYGAARSRQGGNAHKMTCCQRKWKGPLEIGDFFAPLLLDTEPDAGGGCGGKLIVGSGARSLDMRKCLMAGHGATCLARVLVRPQCPLLDLYLFANALQDAGAVTLASGLEGNSSLTKLNLCGNQIGVAGATSLGQALAKHPSLTQCDLNCNELTDEGIAPLTAGLGGSAATSSVLTTLSLRKNGLSDASVDVLYAVCKQNTRLADVAVCSDWPPPRRQKKLLSSSGLADHVSVTAAARLRELLKPRAARLRAARERVDDAGEALRQLFRANGATADGDEELGEGGGMRTVAEGGTCGPDHT